ncbi:MAG: 50S ribosomal protein L6 [Patescibacteria group bacterium]|nr:50S ribosomal protein L6 [Patescibacteria group bacterium]
MSRVGKQIINIPANTQVEIINHLVKVKGPKGELELATHSNIRVIKKDSNIIVEKVGNSKLSRSLHGLTNRLINNMLIGVNQEFTKKLDYKGVGYRISVVGEKLVLNVGYSHPVEIIPPKGIKFKVVKNVIEVTGIDKCLVGQVAAQVRQVRPPEPYKGKGIKYIDEQIKRKPGKAAKAAGPAGGA